MLSKERIAGHHAGREWHQTATALSEAKAELLMAEKIEYIVSNAQVAYMR